MTLASLFQWAYDAKRALFEREHSFPEVVSNYEEYHSVSHISPLSYVRLRLISEWIRPKSSVLDAGCGEGLSMEYLYRNKGCDVQGLDVSAEAARKVRDKGFAAAVVDLDTEGLALRADEMFDYVLFIEVLEHLKNPSQVLIEACRHSLQGVIVTIPNSAYLYWRLQLLRGYSPRQSFTHLHCWSLNDFRIFLRQLNLSPKACKTDLSDGGPMGSVYRAASNLVAYQQCWLISPIVDRKGERLPSQTFYSETV